MKLTTKCINYKRNCYIKNLTTVYCYKCFSLLLFCLVGFRPFFKTICIQKLVEDLGFFATRTETSNIVKSPHVKVFSEQL